MANDLLGPLLTSLMEHDEVVVSGQLPPHDSESQVDARYSRLEDRINHSEQSPRLEAHHQVRQLRANESTPLVRTAARVERSAWSRMSGWSKFFSVITLSIYYHLWKCWNPVVDEDAGFIVGQAAFCDPVRPRIPDFTAHNEVVPLDIHFGTDLLVQEAREKEERELQGLSEFAVAESQMLEQTCEELEKLAQGSGKSRKEFMAALQEGHSYESLGLTYYSWEFAKNPNDIPSKNKKEIQEQYSLAQRCKGHIDELKREIRSKRERIQSEFSSSRQFKEMAEQGMPYELYFGAEHFRQDISLGPRAPFRNYPHTRARLNVELTRWTTGQDSIQLNLSDPAFMAQNYLYFLSRPGIMTLSHDQERSLRQAGLNLVPRRGHRVYLENDGPTPVIRSVRTVDMTNSEGAVEKTYQWTETIRITPGEPECYVTITKNVQETE